MTILNSNNNNNKNNDNNNNNNNSCTGDMKESVYIKGGIH